MDTVDQTDEAVWHNTHTQGQTDDRIMDTIDQKDEFVIKDTPKP